MSTVYIVDSYSLLEMPVLCRPERQLGALLTDMTDLVRFGQLTFPTLVVRECKKYGLGEFPTMWVDAASGHRHDVSPPSEYTETVLADCPDVADWDDPEESVQVDILALALYRQFQGHEVVVVTQDNSDVPERICLLKAADSLAFDAISFPEFLIRSGFSSYLN